MQKRINVFDLLFILDLSFILNAFLYLEPLFQFLGVYFSDFFFFFFLNIVCFFYIVVYMKISFGHRKAIFLVEASCRKLKLKASFDNYL